MKKLLTILLSTLMVLTSVLTTNIHAEEEYDFSKISSVELVLDSNDQHYAFEKVDDSIESGGNGVKYYYEFDYETLLSIEKDLNLEKDKILVTFNDSSTLVLDIKEWTYEGARTFGNEDYLFDKNNNYNLVIKLFEEAPLQSAISDVYIEYNENTFPLSNYYYEYKELMVWSINGENINWSALGQMYQDMEQHYDTVKAKLHYTVGESNKTIDIKHEDLILENIAGSHCFYLNYSENDENGIFIIQDCGMYVNLPDPSGAYAEINGTNYYFEKDNEKSTETDAFYVLKNKPDLQNLGTNEIKVVISEEYDIWTWANLNNVDAANDVFYKGVKYYYTKNNNPDYSVNLVLEYTQRPEEQYLNFLPVDIYDKDNLSFNAWYDEASDEIRMEILVPAEELYAAQDDQYYVDVEFVNIGKHDFVEFVQTEESKVNYEVPQVKTTHGSGDDEVETNKLTLRKYSEPRFKLLGKDSSGKVEQEYNLCLNVNADFRDILNHTMIKDLRSNNYYFDFMDLIRNGYCVNPTIAVETNINTNNYLDTLKGMDLEVTHNDLHLEDDFLNVTFKDGVQILSKKYQIYPLRQIDSPAVVYTLKDADGNEETITIVSEYVKKNEGYEQGIKVGNENFDGYRKTINGEEYRVYNNIRYDISPEKFLELTEYKYHTLFVKAYWQDFNQVDYEDIIYEGFEFSFNNSLVFELYGTNEEIDENNFTPQDLENIRITKFDNNQFVTSLISYFNNYEEAKRCVEQNKLNLVYNVDANGNLKEVIAYDDYDKFIDYNGDDTIAYYSLVKNGNKYYANMILNTKDVLNLRMYSRFGSDIDYDSNKVNKVVEVEHTDGVSDSYALEQAIKSLDDYFASSIKLTSDLTLDKDVYIKHQYLRDAPNDLMDSRYATSGLLIDLNGFNINTGNHSIILLNNSNIYFGNNDTSKKLSKITGTGEYVIFDNANVFYIMDNVSIVNNNGIGVLATDAINNFNLQNDATINAKTGIKVAEYGRSDNNALSIEIRGKISSDDYCVYMDLPTKNLNKENNLLTSNWNDALQKQGDKIVLDSNNVGIFTNGNVRINIQDSIINAKSPFICNNGRLSIRTSDITATGNYNANNSFSLDDANGALILCDSSSANSGSMSIEADAGWGTKLVSNGPIVADTSNKSNINKINFYSSNQRSYDQYFDYGSEKIFENVDRNVVSITGGNYSIKQSGVQITDGSNNEIKDYVDSSYTFEVRQDSGNSNYYFCIVKPETYKIVNDYDEFKSAAENTNISFIDVNSDFDANNEIININCSTYKNINFNNHSIRNVQFNVTGDITSENSQLYLQNCAIENDKQSDNKTPIVNNGAWVILDNCSVICNDNNGALLKNGRIELRNSSIKGKFGIVVDEIIANGNYGRIFVQSDSQVCGTAGPAIYVKKTNYNLNNDNIQIGFGGSDLQDNSRIYTTNSNNGNPNNNSAIYVDDYYRVFFENGYISSNRYAVEFSDNIQTKAGDFANMPAVYTHTMSNINTLNGYYIPENCELSIEAGNVEVANNVIDCYELSQISIRAGYISAVNKIFNFIDNKPTSKRSSHENVSGGFYSLEVDDVTMMDTFDRDYDYLCLQVDDLNSKYPYAVVKKYKENKTYQSVSIGYAREINVDPDRLDSAISEAERKALEKDGEQVDIVITVKEEKDEDNIEAFKDYDCKEQYDIHMNKNVGKNKKRVDEVDDYQRIDISLEPIEDEGINYSNYDNIVIVHKHGKGDPKPMKKTTPENGELMQEECYFINEIGGKVYASIITKKFSSFGVVETNSKVNAESLKPSYELTLKYENSYVEGEQVTIPNTATYENGTISISNVKVKYYSKDNCTYYSETNFPTQPGQYTVEWVVNEDQEFVGSGKQDFTIIEAHVHNFNKKVNNVQYLKSEATCTEAAVYYYSCECGESSETETFVYGDALGHAFSEEWTKNETHHWHVATCGHGSEKAAYGEHVWNDGVETTPATHTSTGIKTYTCTECGQTKTEVIKKLSKHVFDKKVTTKDYLKSEATCTSPAIYYYSCECGEKGTDTFESGSALGHTFSEEWSKNETHHWHAATCEHTDEKDSYAQHVWNDGVETIPATHLQEGEKLYTCTVCKQTKIEKIDKISTHTYDQSIVDDKYLKAEATCTTPAIYYYSCECGEKGTDTFESGSALGHSLQKVDATVIDGTAIKEHYVCTVCGDIFVDADGKVQTTIKELSSSVVEISNSIDELDKVEPGQISSELTSIVESLGTETFTKVVEDSIGEEGGMLDTLAALEAKLSNTTEVEASDEIKDTFDVEKISIVGASFSSDSDLSFNVDENESNDIIDDVEEDVYDTDKSVCFSLNITKVDGSEIELKVPVVIELPVPSGLDVNKIVLFHRHDGVNTKVDLYKFVKDTVNYIRFVVGNFSDFMLVEEKQQVNPTPHYVAPKTGVDSNIKTSFVRIDINTNKIVFKKKEDEE